VPRFLLSDFFAKTDLQDITSTQDFTNNSHIPRFIINHNTPRCLNNAAKLAFEEACEKLHNYKKSYVAAVAREFEMPEARLRVGWNECQLRQNRPAADRRPTQNQELAVCPYLSD